MAARSATRTTRVWQAPADWQALPAQTTLDRLETSVAGLTSVEAALRLRRAGPNLLPTTAPPGALQVGLRQLKSPLIYVLLAAALASLWLGEIGDAGFIGVVLLVNSAIGGWQEWRAERQRHSLQQLLQVRATVLRDGQFIDVDAAGLVPGDVVALESGQRIAADLRLLDTHGLEIDEALLTGESLPVAKDAAWIGQAGMEPADCVNLAFAGSSVARGRGNGVVVATGASTLAGQLAIAITAADTGKPPLVERMERFSRVIALAVLAAALLIGAVAVLWHGAGVATMFTFGVALAVSAIPEGLPVAITIALAVAARRMASRGAIVRRLPAVESLGSCTLIASDKTGTLTCNELTVREFLLADGTRGKVTGAGYEPTGRIEHTDTTPFPPGDACLTQLLEVAAACNEGDLRPDGPGWAWRGDPTDVALLSLAHKGGVQRATLLEQRPLTAAIPFEPEHGFAVTFHRDQAGTTWIAAKGAPERVLSMCNVDATQRARAQSAQFDMAGRGQRVLALAAGFTADTVDGSGVPPPPTGLQFAGLVGLVDPLRPEAAAALQDCRSAGVRVIMMTGDHPVTALAIARELGIAATAADVIHGPDLRSASEDLLVQSVASTRVYARVNPAQKLAIVRAAQQAGHFVAVTGDGVNDAPALRHANIGIAMGRGGTDVARDAADVVLSDDNFATIVAGVEEGRVAYKNIRNVVYLVIAAGIAEVLTVGLAVIAGLPLPLLPTQLLWLNLVTNGIQDVSLAFEKGRGDEMRSPPRRPDEPVFDRLMLERGLLGGLWMALLGFALYGWMIARGVAVPDARNALMLLMVLMQNVDAFNARSETISVFRIPLGHNPLLVAGVTGALLLHVAAMHVPLLQRVLQLGPLPAAAWIALGAASLSLLLVMELQKSSWRRRSQRAAQNTTSS